MSEPAAAEPAVGTVVAHRWRLVERLALEGDTLVFRAEDLRGGKPALLKLLDARCAASRELAARFDRDARTVSRLDHPNCVPILDFGLFETRPYLVMPQVSGRRLADELGKPQLTPTRAVRLATQLLEGLRHGHAYGVVHRELGPDKIWLTGNGNAPDHVKILDFGLARISGDDKKRTAANAFGCLAPEQLQQRSVDQRADLFAVGVLLRAMASGQTLPAPVADGGGGGRALTPALQRVVARALAKDPEQRFADAGEFLDELEAIGEGRTAKRRKVDIAPPPRLGRAAGLALAALVIVGGAVGWWAHARRARKASEPVATAQPTVAPASPTVAPASPTVAPASPTVATPQPTVVPASPTIATPHPATASVTASPATVAPATAPVAAPPAAKSVSASAPIASSVDDAPNAKPTLAKTAPAKAEMARPKAATTPIAAAAPAKMPPTNTKTSPVTSSAAAVELSPTAVSNAASAKTPTIAAAATKMPARAVVATKPANAAPAVANAAPPVVPAPAVAKTPAATTTAGKPGTAVAAATPAAKSSAVAAPAAPPLATAANEPAPASEAARVTALLAAGKLADAEQALRAQLDLHAESAELHYLLGEVFFRKFWRRDAIVEWDRALALAPSLRRDPRLTTRLCATLGARWRGAGAELITKRFAADAVPLLRGCVATATDLERLQSAAQLAEQLGGKSAIDPQLIARRTQELTPATPPPAAPKP